MSNRSRNTLPLVTVLVGGCAIKATPQSIRPAAAVCHGEYKGTTVNSPALAIVGDSVVLYPDEKNPHKAQSMTKAEFAATAQKFAQIENVTFGTGTAAS